MSSNIKLAVGLGDPAGIGSEIVAKAILKLKNSPIEFDLFCRHEFFKREQVRDKWPWVRDFLDYASYSGKVNFMGFPSLKGEVEFGKNSEFGGEFAYKSFIAAADSAMRGDCHALTAAPLSKESLNMAGYCYPGQTEILRELAGVDRVVMMLLAGDFRVVPMTRHIALSKVPGAINENILSETIEITHKSLTTYERIDSPRIALLALNPHGGENGLFGDEEEIIRASLEKFLAHGYSIEGPLVPDTAFLPEKRQRFDVIIGMYHDQVLIPLKMAGFAHGVNATLGLPFIRTSPDHGTAFDIAGKDLADCSSIAEAFKLAAHWANNLR